jgi:hypothetical protein
MKTSSLNRVHQELHAAWQRGEPVELQRIGDRKFAVGEVAARPGEFVFNAGFTDGTPNSAARNRQARHRLDMGSGRRTRETSKRLGLSRRSLALIAVVVVAVVAWKGYRVATVLHSVSQPVTLSKQQAMAALPSGARKRLKAAVKTCLALVPEVPVEPGLQSMLVTRDITIGGERQQVIVLDCGLEKKTMTLRFSLQNGQWQIKSATPSGSRSLLSSN